MSLPNGKEIEAKFWSEVKVGAPGECWPWTGKLMGGRGALRYGRFTDGRWTYYAHRYAYAIGAGAIPSKAVVMHDCDNPLCCNPAHLKIGTQADNVADMVAKGRCIRAKGAAHGLAKLTPDKVLAIFNDQRPYRAICKDHGVGMTAVGNIKRGETWSHVTGKQRAA